MVRALTRRGLRVQPFKVGPDFLDPTYLTLAAGRDCLNLDSWMMGPEYVKALFARSTADADVAVIEGVMGLFDGADADGLAGSTAEIAKILNVPVLLLVHAHGVARSIAPLVKGFAEFEEGVDVAGVVANRAGSSRHREILAEALSTAGLPPLLGSVPRDAYPELQSRHLGLLTADRESLPESTLESLADAVEAHLDLEHLLEIARPPVGEAGGESSTARTPASPRVRLGVARDSAFHFYYRDNLEVFERLGAELIFFSPLLDTQLPEGVDALYLGGGYPEVHAPALSQNRGLLASIRAFAESGRVVYAECGGLVYLSQSIETLEGKALPLAGVLPFRTRMLERRKALGYVEVETTAPSVWGGNRTLLRGHEFHYSEIVGKEPLPEGWSRTYRVQARRSAEPVREGYARGNILASYMHLHWACHEDAARHFLESCAQASAPA
jgi:cobyrinic acid a,c-diamide synthase